MILGNKQYILLSLAILLIVLVAYVISIELDDTQVISQSEFIIKSKSNQKPLLVDVRYQWEYQIDHVPGAVNASYVSLSHSKILNDADKDELIVVYCETGVRSRIAQAILKQAGYKNIKRLDGDIRAWRKSGLPLVKKTKIREN